MKNEFRKIKVPVTENEQFLVTAVMSCSYFYYRQSDYLFLALL